MRRIITPAFLVLFLFSALISCGGGGGSAPPVTITSHSVTLNWTANREKGVNSPGGGYQVSVNGQPTIDVPYVSGPVTATTTSIVLKTGTYSATVRAYAALDAQGGSTGSVSLSSSSIAIHVP